MQVEDDEIDLRPYLAVMLRHWKLIAGLSVLAALIAGAMSLAMPANYLASATVAVAGFGSKPVPDAKAYQELATSDGVLSEVLRSQFAATGDEKRLLDEFRSRAKVVVGPDPSLMILRVQDTDFQRAANAASAWSSTLVRVATATFNSARVSSEQLENQLKLAREELLAAESQLADAQKRNNTEVQATELETRMKRLAGLYAGKATLQSARQEAASLLNRLRRLDSASLANSGDEIAMLMIQAKVLSLGTDVPVQLQLASGSGYPSQPVSAQVAHIEALVASIDERVQETDTETGVAQGTIIDLQEKVQKAQAEEAALESRRDNARLVAKEIDLKAAQARTAAGAGASQVRVVAEIPVETDDISRGTVRNTVIAALLGLMLGLAAAFGLEWLTRRQGDSASRLTAVGDAEPPMVAP